MNTSSHSFFFSFHFEGWGENESYGTAASNGPIIPALDDRSVWSVGGVITDRVKLKFTEKYLLLYHFIHKKTNID
jgi:hypothetical protein